MSGETILYLQMEARDIEVEVRVNDIPLAWCRPGLQRIQGVALREWLVAGENTLSVRIAASGRPVGAGAELLARVARFRHLEDLDPDAGQQLAAIRPVGLERLAVPAEQLVRFETRGADDGIPFPWAWSRAPALAGATGPGAVPPGAVEAQVTALAAMFAAADIDGLVAAMAVPMQELPQAYPAGSRAMMEAALREDLSRLAALEPARRRIPLDQARLRPAAGGRLAEPIDAEGLPLLRSRGGAAGQDVVLRLFLGLGPAGLGVLR